MLSVSEFDEQDDRYSRLRLIPWWDQERIASSKILVVGAGALGNEILKNLALLGFRNVVIVDLDCVEISNLSRTVLFRTRDLGRFKAIAAAEAYKELVDGAEIKPVVGNVMYGCGLGLFEWADVIVAGLDNREARLWINRSAWKVGRPWVDGAIEGINGVARVFIPGHPPCYECTLGEVDWAILDRRMSCNLLANRTDTEGRVPTTPTISSIIAGIQVQEAVKLLHGLPTLAGQGFVFEGMNHTSYKVEYTENPDCMSHYTIPEWNRLPETSGQWTLHDLWRRARHDLSATAVTIEFSRDVIWRFSCPRCGNIEELFAPVGSVPYERGACACDRQQRVVDTIHNYSGTEPWGERQLSQLGLPLWDVFAARSSEREIGYIAEGDRTAVLGIALAEESVPA
ncbi:MAG: ThiF family adenylyltransferase [Acidobacteriaceae bacterium]|nr:ThiF family adenylyltransferase [Acidobacteriaceae bacterium]